MILRDSKGRFVKGIKRRPHSKEIKKKISLSNKGKKLSEETKRKISKAKSGKSNFKLKGKPLSKKHCKKLSKTMKRLFKEGKIKPFLQKGHKINVGRKHSEKSKRKMSKIAKKLKRTFSKKAKINRLKNLPRGKNHYNWKGGKSFESYGFAFNKQLKEFIRKRDNYRCQQCFREQNELFTKNKNGKIVPRKLDIHHIDFNKKNNSPNNLISLCQNCHMRTNFNRENWINYFKNKLLEIEEDTKLGKKLLRRLLG